MSIVLGLPSKGSLYDGAVSLLNRAGLGLKSRGRGQSYWGKLVNVDSVAVQFMRAEELPFRVASGDIHLAITGLDLVKETSTNPGDSFGLIDDLHYGHARLVAAVPNYWLDVNTFEDLGEVAIDIKSKMNRNLRVGTKFINLTRKFFEQHGVLDFSIVKSAGATEAMPQAGAADIVVDLTSTGKTLIGNNLKEIQGGTVIESQACLIGSRSIASLAADDVNRVKQILEMIEASLLSRDHCLIHFSIEEQKLGHLKETLKQENGCIFDYEPSIPKHDLPGAKPVFTGIICPVKETYNVVSLLREEQAFGISVGESSLMFSSQPKFTSRLDRILNQDSPLH